MVVASPLPAIVCGQFTEDRALDTLWLPTTSGLQVGGLALLLLAALLWSPSRPMRLPLLMLLAFLVGWRVLTPLVTESAAWAQWQANQSIGMSLATSRLQWLPPATLMTVAAVGAGMSRVDLYLVKGNWAAQVSPEPLLPLRGWRWYPGMFVMFLFLTVATFTLVEFVLGMRGWVTALEPDFNKAERVLVYSPGIVAGSILNAVSEEYIFRAMLLGCFIPAVGIRHALGLTAVLFGLEHWPTAGIGIILTCYSGWIYAKSVSETRGWTWALVQHVAADIPIYALVAMARP
jgi:membrane protease YdiL (CAAX protease family)